MDPKLVEVVDAIVAALKKELTVRVTVEIQVSNQPKEAGHVPT